MAGRWQKAREGKWNGGFAPYGYEIDNGVLKINEDEAVAIRLIFDKYGNTSMGIDSVAKWLNENGYKKIVRQNGTLDKFSQHFIKIVLDNPVYAGFMPYGRRRTEKIEGTRNEYHIVPQEEYDLFEGKHEASVQLYEQRQPNGLWVKSVRFKVPLEIEGQLLDTIEVSGPDDDDGGSPVKPKKNGGGSGNKNSLPSATHDETVCLLTRE